MTTEDSPNGSTRVLVVDDERDNRELVEIVLRWDGFVILTAASGEEALAIVGQKLPDLVLLDIMMPAMTGYQVAERIRADATTRHIPIVMLTALDDPEARQRALAAGADRFLKKPISRGELLACVKSVLSRRFEPAEP